MCGIVGFLDKKTQSEKAVIIKDMMDAIIHRGPNSAGQYIDDDAALGFRRLSIIDLEGGSQPLYNEEKTKVLTFNGEIYNPLGPSRPMTSPLSISREKLLTTWRFLKLFCRF